MADLAHFTEYGTAPAPTRRSDLRVEVGLGPAEDTEVVLAADDDVAVMVRRMEAELATIGRPAPPGNLWDSRRRILPAPIVNFLRSAVRVDFVRETVLGAAEEDLLAEIPEEMRDVAAIEALWRQTCSRGRLPGTLRWLRALRDQVVRSHHGGSCYQHARFKEMPLFLRRWKPEDGVLVVDDLRKTIPSIGYAPYLEQTPPLLVLYIFESWKRRWLNETRATLLKRRPGVWDPFGGSGTSSDLLGGLFGCAVVATDLASCNEVVQTLDARRLGTLYEHGGVSNEQLRAISQGSDNAVVRNPDIVLIDPPSRGRPTHSEVYVSQWPGLDLGLLDRNEWIEAVSDVVKGSVRRLAPHGVVSLLLRHGVRDRQRIEPDDQLVHDVKSTLGTDVQVVEQVRIEFRNRVRQASLGTQRVPATHLLLWRAT